MASVQTTVWINTILIIMTDEISGEMVNAPIELEHDSRPATFGLCHDDRRANMASIWALKTQTARAVRRPFRFKFKGEPDQFLPNARITRSRSLLRLLT